MLVLHVSKDNLNGMENYLLELFLIVYIGIYFIRRERDRKERDKPKGFEAINRAAFTFRFYFVFIILIIIFIYKYFNIIFTEATFENWWKV